MPIPKTQILGTDITPKLEISLKTTTNTLSPKLTRILICLLLVPALKLGFPVLVT